MTLSSHRRDQVVFGLFILVYFGALYAAYYVVEHT